MPSSQRLEGFLIPETASPDAAVEALWKQTTEEISVTKRQQWPANLRGANRTRDKDRSRAPNAAPLAASRFILTRPSTQGIVWKSAAPCSILHLAGFRSMPSKHRVSVNLSADEHRELAALAERTRISKAWLARQAIVEFLERQRTAELQLPLNLPRAQKGRNNGEQG